MKESPAGEAGAGPKTLALVSCVKDKLACTSRAIEMYQGFFFQASLRYAASFVPDAIYILSGKYGLLSPDEMIEPYDCNLAQQAPAYRDAWSQRVLVSLNEVSHPRRDRYILLAEPAYRDGLVPHLDHVVVPFAGLSLDQQGLLYREWYGPDDD